MASKISILAAERNRNGYKSADHQLTGIVRCSACNSQYFYWRNAERTKFYYKHHASSTRERRCKQIPKCINAKAFENLFELCTLITLFSVFETESYVKKQLRQIEDNSREALLTSKDLIAQRAKIIAAIERLLDAVETQGASPEIRDRLSKRQAERQEIDDRLRLHENQSAKAKQDILELQIAFGTDTAQALREANGDVKRRLYISLLESASVKNGVLTLVYRNGKTFSIGIPQRSNTIAEIQMSFPYAVEHHLRVMTVEGRHRSDLTLNSTPGLQETFMYNTLTGDRYHTAKPKFSEEAMIFHQFPGKAFLNGKAIVP